MCCKLTQSGIERLENEYALAIPLLGLYVRFSTGGIGMVNLEELHRYEMQYAMNNGVICFVENSRAYLLKGYGFEEQLIGLGFKKSSFPVPLSNSETLMGPMTAERWATLPTA